MKERQAYGFGPGTRRRLPPRQARSVRVLVWVLLALWLGRPSYVMARLLALPYRGELVLTRTTVPGGWRFAVTEYFDDPFGVRLYSQHSDAPVIEHYVDHEALLWTSARLTYDAGRERVLLWHGRALVGSFDLQTQQLYLADRGEIDRHGNVRL